MLHCYAQTIRLISVMKYLYLAIVIFLSGCSAITQELEAYAKTDIEPKPRDNYQPTSEEGQVHDYVESLARQLFDTSYGLDMSQSVIIGTFLPAGSLTPEMNHALKAYGIQLQESFSTLSMQAGLSVIEYKSLSGVMVTNEADVMLSRDKSKLNQKFNAQYLLTGNYIEQENSLVVNVKLIALSDKRLVGAATGYIPTNSFYSQNKVKLKNGHLYRGEY